ncbi:MAG: hypothetical protein M1828_005858 [Chrysothrix sp. TS-e1954]|nr:MAG: hypothetical protein M1828_005858 [Chrysothrix sp. TS-e1954]
MSNCSFTVRQSPTVGDQSRSEVTFIYTPVIRHLSNSRGGLRFVTTISSFAALHAHDFICHHSPQAMPSTTLTAVELQAHPEYPHVIWNLSPSRSGLVDVSNPNAPILKDENNINSTASSATPHHEAADVPNHPSPRSRPSPLRLPYAIHGHGPTRLVLIMGLGTLKESWQRQTKDFGHTHGEEYSVLIFDNRGIGDSDVPWGRYSTSEMAWDALGVLNAVGWLSSAKSQRDLNVVGVSMGGMIAQELAALLPTRIQSLLLLSTAPEIINTKGYLENLRSRVNLFVPKSLDKQLDYSGALLYSNAFLTGADNIEHTVQPFPTAGDRFAAMEIWKRTSEGGRRLSRVGFISQAIAAGWHRKDEKQLGGLADKVGRNRILVLHGSDDHMIDVRHADMLTARLNHGASSPDDEVGKIIMKGQGHVIPVERREDFNKILEDLIVRTQQLSR